MRHTLLILLLGSAVAFSGHAQPDLILYGGRIVTVDDAFSIHEAMSVREGRIVAVGSSQSLLGTRGEATRVVDLRGATVLPGLMDSHVHPGAALTELDHPIPDMETIADVLAYMRERARVVPEGQWIVLQQVFITRLREQRYPTLAELDAAAPRHPVLFRTGPDCALNSAGLREAKITRDSKVPDGVAGKIEFDAAGEPNGILRGYGNFTRLSLDSGRAPSDAEKRARTLDLFRDYLATGLTTVCDRGANAGSIAMYERMRAEGQLPLRLMLSYTIPTTGPMDGIRTAVRQIAAHPLRAPDDRLRIIGTKLWLDGGMLTGSAYMRDPWGVSRMYGIDDPAYRGVLNVPPPRLRELVETVVESGMQFTAHAVGDGAVHTLLDTYEAVDVEGSIRRTRACFTHSNFMSEDSVKRAARLGAVHDIQPAWLYLDSRTLERQFGDERMRWFQPLKSIFEAGGIVGGGSDHMQKIGSLRSINPYNPFLAMWVAITRSARWHDGKIHPEEALSREQAIRFYTRNNAYLLFLEDRLGSLEPGKLADFIVLDRDILTCPVDEIKDIRVRETWVGGERVQR
jgi:hypothetical protein